MSKLKMVVEARCIKDVGFEEVGLCFEKGQEYLFCYNHMNNDIITVDETGNVHFLTLGDEYYKEHFVPTKPIKLEDAFLSDDEIIDLENLFDERHHYMTDEEIDAEI